MKQSTKSAISVELKTFLQKSIPANVNGDEIKIKLDYPPDFKMGDYSSPLAMENAKIFRQAPRAIAENIAASLKDGVIVSKILASAEVAGPGFLNFRLHSGYFNESIAWMADENNEPGRDLLKSAVKDKIIIEYVSANPTGPLNIVSARAASIGSALVNLWRYLGIEVASEFYVNDYGNQVNLLAKSVACRYLQGQGHEIDFPEDGYHGEYVYDIAEHCQKVYAKELSAKKWSTENIDELSELFRETALQYNIDQQKNDLRDFGVEFDRWFSERSLHEDKKPQQSFEKMKKSGYIYTEESKEVFASTQFQDDKDRVLQRADGRPTYFMADIAYHQDKMERGFTKMVNIWGPDHHGYIARLNGAMQALGYPSESLEILIAQQVNLLEDGELVKMSKRKGKFTTLRELMQEIPRDVSRYFFVMRATDSPLDYDINLAKSQTMENPVYYIQYAHARICSVLRENDKGEKVEPSFYGAEDFWKIQSRRTLALYLLRFSDELKDIALNREIHRLAVYLKDLAAVFQRFYQDRENRVLGNEKEVSASLLMLMLATRNVLRKGLGILRISAPESM